jgi:hypothetical protein
MAPSSVDPMIARKRPNSKGRGGVVLGSVQDTEGTERTEVTELSVSSVTSVPSMY